MSTVGEPVPLMPSISKSNVAADHFEKDGALSSKMFASPYVSIDIYFASSNLGTVADYGPLFLK